MSVPGHLAAREAGASGRRLEAGIARKRHALYC